jgi:hypothetical protein
MPKCELLVYFSPIYDKNPAMQLPGFCILVRSTDADDVLKNYCTSTALSSNSKDDSKSF